MKYRYNLFLIILIFIPNISFAQNLEEMEIIKTGIFLKIELEATTDWGSFELQMNGNNVPVCTDCSVRAGEESLKRIQNYYFAKESFDKTLVKIDFDVFLSNASPQDTLWIFTRKGDIGDLTMKIYDSTSERQLATIINDKNIQNDSHNHVEFSMILNSAKKSNLNYTRKSLEPKLFAFYYPWYATPEGDWGKYRAWVPGRENMGAAREPKMGYYDSLKDSVIENHFNLASESGIDVFISSWWGIETEEKNHHPYTDKVMPKLLDKAFEHDMQLTIYFEGSLKMKEDSPEVRYNISLRWLKYLLKNYSSHPAFFKVDNRPVVFVWTRMINWMSLDLWKSMETELRRDGYDPLFIMDTINPKYAKTFPIHVYNPLAFGKTLPEMTESYEALDILSGINEDIFMLTLIPGYDDSNIYSKPTVVDREHGKFYVNMWDTALSYNPNWILITSWNEWLEGTEIEPSKALGIKYLKITEKKSENFHQKK